MGNVLDDVTDDNIDAHHVLHRVDELAGAREASSNSTLPQGAVVITNFSDVGEKAETR